MSEMTRIQRQAGKIKENYPSGTRIHLDNMNDPFSPVPSGTRGTVDLVDDIGQIHMTWDNGRTLALVPSVDSFRKLTDKELLEEQMKEMKPALDDMMTSASARLKQQAKEEIQKLDKDISFADQER